MKQSGIDPVAMVLFAIMMTESAWANRLEAAAQRSSQMLMTIGQATSIIGILLGGIALTFGMGQVGKMILTSGIIGALCVFGGPAFIEFLRGFFG